MGVAEREKRNTAWRKAIAVALTQTHHAWTAAEQVRAQGKNIKKFNAKTVILINIPHSHLSKVCRSYCVRALPYEQAYV